MNIIKICAIVGTLHKNSNTVYFTTKFIEILKEKIKSEVIVNVYCLSKYDLKVCEGCLACLKLGKCVQNDDMEILKKAMLDADIIIWATPVYMDSISGVLKNFIDRLHLWTKIIPLRSKYGIVLSTSSHKITKEFVQDYLNWIQCTLGLMNIGTYNICVDIPAQLYSEKVDNIIDKYVQKTGENMKEKIKNLQLEERNFKNLKKVLIALEESGINSIILQYWKDTGLLYCDSFLDCIENTKKQK